MEKKRHSFEIQLNAISDSDNPTKKDCEFVLHGFDISHNHAFISKGTAENTLHTLKGMPIVARYYSKSSPENNDDALGSHEMYLDRDRDSGEVFVAMDTVPIGVFTEDAYITTVTDSEGNEKEVVAGKGILWASRFPNVVGLLKEWMDEGIAVVSSMEILYDSYKVEDGVTEILSYVYEGHCVLNSQERGNHQKVYPAYDESKLTKLVAQAIEQEKESKEVVEVMEEKELQQEETVEEVAEETVEKEVNVESEVTEETIEETIEQESSEVTELQNQLSSLQEKYSSLENQFNEVSEKLVQLNSIVEELKPYKEEVETANYEKALNEKKDFYSAKFSALKAAEKFDSEEVQELVRKAVSEDEEGKSAILQLNTMLVELVEIPVVQNPENPVIREHSSKRENLIPTSDDFESRYSL